MTLQITDMICDILGDKCRPILIMSYILAWMKWLFVWKHECCHHTLSFLVHLSWREILHSVWFPIYANSRLSDTAVVTAYWITFNIDYNISYIWPTVVYYMYSCRKRLCAVVFFSIYIAIVIVMTQPTFLSWFQKFVCCNIQIKLPHRPLNKIWFCLQLFGDFRPI